MLLMWQKGRQKLLLLVVSVVSMLLGGSTSTSAQEAAQEEDIWMQLQPSPPVFYSVCVKRSEKDR